MSGRGLTWLHDQGPVRQLRRPEDDRDGGREGPQPADEQDQAPLQLTAQVLLREVHPCQA